MLLSSFLTLYWDLTAAVKIDFEIPSICEKLFHTFPLNMNATYADLTNS